MSFRHVFGLQGSNQGNRTSGRQTRRLLIEPLEERALLAVSTMEFNQIVEMYSDQYPSTNLSDDNVAEITKSQYAENVILTDAIASISPFMLDSCLFIEGTENADWIEIQETTTQIIVHSFNATGTTRFNQWSFEKTTISTIIFNGYGGNDTFQNAYDGVNCSIVCRLDGGIGNDTLIGGDGDDWIYGGTGANILDGGNGDNIVIGGYGNNTFSNTGIGSNCFVWMGGATNNHWASGSSSRSAGDDDALLIFSDKDRLGNSTHTFNNVTYVFASWTEDQVLAVVDYIELIYERIGSYQFFQHQTFDDYSIYFCYTTNANVGFNAWCGYNSGIHFKGAAKAASSTLIHEVAHLWNFIPGDYWGNANSFFDEFWKISWDGPTGATQLLAGHQFDDFPSAYAYGYNKDGSVYSGATPGTSREDWAETIKNVVMGVELENASQKYLQKVAIVKSFFKSSFGSDLPSISITSPQLTVTGTSDGIVLTWDVITGAYYQIDKWNADISVWETLDYISSTIYVDTTARAGVNERYRVRAINVFGTAGGYANSNYVSILPAPTGVSAIDASTTSLTVTWDRVTSASGYRIEYAADKEFTQIWGTQLIGRGSTTTCDLTGLATGQSYYIRVIATGNNYADSPPSDYVLAATLSHTSFPDLEALNGGSVSTNPIVKGSTFSVTTGGIQNIGTIDSGGFSVTFYASTGFATLFTSGIELGSVHMASLAANGTTTVTLNDISTELLDDDTSYYIGWRIMGVSEEINTNNNTGYSTTPIPVIADSTDDNLPSTPVNFRSTGQTSDSVTLTWDVATGAAGYALQYKKATDTTWTTAPDPKGTSATITNLTANTEYDFRIRATNVSGSSDWVTVEATTPMEPPQDPVNFRSTGQTSDSVTLTWDAATGATDYVLQYKKATDTTWTTAPDPKGTSATITNLTANTEYDFRIRATNVSGSSDWVTVEATTPMEPPQDPVNFRSTEQTSDSVTLTWDAATGATGYTLEYKKAVDFQWTTAFIAYETLTATITNLTANTEYDFRIRATNTGGASDWVTVNVATSLPGTMTMPSDGSPRHWVVRKNPVENDILEIADMSDGRIVDSFSMETFDVLVINGSGVANDSLTIDFEHGGSFLLGYGIEFNGGTGNETLAFIGSDADDILQINVDATQHYYGGLPIYLTNIENVTIDGRDGNDQIWMDGTDGNDTFRFKRGITEFSVGKTGFETVNVEEVFVDAHGGTDTANVASTDYNNTFSLWDNFFVMTGGDYRLELKNFNTIEAVANGRNDRTYVYGENDTFILMNDINTERRAADQFYRVWYSENVTAINMDNSANTILHQGSQGTDRYTMDTQRGTATNAIGSYFHEWMDFGSVTVSNTSQTTAVSLSGKSDGASWLTEDNRKLWTQGDSRITLLGPSAVTFRGTPFEAPLPDETLSQEVAQTAATTVPGWTYVSSQTTTELLYAWIAEQQLQVNRKKSDNVFDDINWLSEFEELALLELRK